MRKRRPRVVWLPLSTQLRVNGVSGALDPGAFRFIVDVPTFAIPAGVTGICPVVQDEPLNLAFGGPIASLSDKENSGYRLRRIVGKVTVSANQIVESNTWTKAIVTAGLIVLRCAPNGQPLVSSIDSYSVQSLDNNADPWIWRRSWFLGNNANALAGGAGGAFWPETNITNGSAVDGPHVDQKTARLIQTEERLFLVVTGVGIDGNPIISTPNGVNVIGEFRVLASMRTSSGNRRNASR